MSHKLNGVWSLLPGQAKEMWKGLMALGRAIREAAALRKAKILPPEMRDELTRMAIEHAKKRIATVVASARKQELKKKKEARLAKKAEDAEKGEGGAGENNDEEDAPTEEVAKLQL